MNHSSEFVGQVLHKLQLSQSNLLNTAYKIENWCISRPAVHNVYRLGVTHMETEYNTVKENDAVMNGEQITTKRSLNVQSSYFTHFHKISCLSIDTH